MTRIEQGPQVGRQYPPEMTEYSDDRTGATVRKITDARGHDHHLYFTNPGWYDDGRRLLFSSDRTRRPNLYSVDLETWRITQLTDLPPLTHEGRRGSYSFPFLPTSVNPERPEAYFWQEDALVALDLDSLALRVLWEHPEGYDPSITNVTADGEYVCTSVVEQPDVEREAGYGGFEETWAARPESRVVAVPTDGSGDAQVLHEEAYWIGHVNTSPARADLLTFCHEGPWEKVDNRIWGLNRETGETWPIREHRDDDERVGHEFWLADGETIGYHGDTADGDPTFGFTRYDNTDQMETIVRPDSWHFHARDRDLVVGDGSREEPYVFLYDFDGDDYVPYRLARHRGSWHTQNVHVHARFSPDGSRVLYTSDHLGYGDVYLADVPDRIGDLPRADTEA